MGKKHLSLFLLFLVFTFTVPAQAVIYFAGGEDIDFPNSLNGPQWSSGGWSRGTYTRTGISNKGNGGSFFKSNAFTPTTNFWLTYRTNYDSWSASVGPGVSSAVAVGKGSTNVALSVGTASGTWNKLALFVNNGSTFTQLASESGTSISGSCNGANYKIDMQVTNYGTNATVNVYFNGGGTPVITYTGDVTAGSGTTNVDTVFIPYTPSSCQNASEIIVSSSDTRTYSLMTLYPSAAGTTNNWASAAYSNINPTWINDASNNSDGAVGTLFQCKFPALPTGNWAIQAVRVAARALTTSGTSPSSISLGVYTTTGYNPANTTLTSTWNTYEYMYGTNPITSTNWTPTDLGVLQLNLKTGL